MQRYALLVLLALAAFGEYQEVNGLKMYYEVHGEGPPLVLLHGGFNTIQSSFSKQISVFAQNHHVIALEQMAHGHTADVRGRELSYEGMADDTAALLVRLGVRNADFVGWSDGGQIALRLAFKHPELVRRVVVSGVAFGPSPEMLKQLADTASFTDRVARGKAEYARVSPDGPDHWSRYVDKTRAMWSKPAWGISEAELASIKQPVLVVAGDRDFIQIEETVHIFRAIPEAKLYIVPGTGHATFRDRPDWLNAMILQFLDIN